MKKPKGDQQDSFRVQLVKCRVFYFQRLVRGNVISHIEVKEFQDPYKSGGLRYEIHKMYTKPEYRGRSFVTDLIVLMMNQKGVNEITTSYIDSTDAGRGLLTRMGFKRIKDELKWQRNWE